MLLYLSADGCFPTTKHPQDCKNCSIFSILSLPFSPIFLLFLILLYDFSDGYDLGGVQTSCKKEDIIHSKKTLQLKEMHWYVPLGKKRLNTPCLI